MIDDDARRLYTAAQWRGAHLLSDGAPTTRQMIATIMGCDVRTVYARAAREGWRSADFRKPATKRAWANYMKVAFGDGAAGDAGDFDGHHSERPGIWPDTAGADGDGAPATSGETSLGRNGDFPDAAGNAAGDAGESAGEAESDDPVEMLTRGVRFMSRRLTRLMRQAERGGQISKQEIDNLVAMTRMMERWETLAKERAMQKETESDEQLAETLRIINAKIVELAHEEARRLVTAGTVARKRRKAAAGVDHAGEAPPVSAVEAGAGGA